MGKTERATFVCRKILYYNGLSNHPFLMKIVIHIVTESGQVLNIFTFDKTMVVLVFTYFGIEVLSCTHKANKLPLNFSLCQFYLHFMKNIFFYLLYVLFLFGHTIVKRCFLKIYYRKICDSCKKIIIKCCSIFIRIIFYSLYAFILPITVHSFKILAI